ncbi:nitronate monooxygenase [Herbiconiux sp. VKM Ac-2851]|nr:nitronate monooxygenase [Herbiconiux sp. VKM Ac-2851]
MSLGATIGVEAPIVLGPFGGVSSVELAAIVSDRGGLGTFGLYGYDAERIRQVAAELHARTRRPFALNLWVPTGDEAEPADAATAPAFAKAAASVAPLFAEVGLEVPGLPDAFLPPFGEQVDAVLEARPAAVSFVFGVPPEDVVERAHRAGIVVIGTATTVDEAVALERGGVDVIVASGSDAGGHRTSFLRPAEQSLVGTMALVPQVVDAVGVPVVAAGGIADRRGVAAASALGADGVQVGTAFLRTQQSAAPESHRQAIPAAAAHDTVLTRAMSGRLARGLPNRALRTIEEADAIAPFPAQNWLTGRFRAAASRLDRGDLLSLWAGQSAALARLDDATAVFDELRAGLPPAR